MKLLVKLATVFIVAIIVFGSCTSQKELTYLNNLDSTDIAQFYPKPPPLYKIQKRDILYVSITTMDSEVNEILNQGTSNTSRFNLSESGTYILGYTVSDSGTISLPIIGNIYVYNHTIEEIASLIKHRALKYLKDPYINIRLLSYKFTVIGEVNAPGMYTNYNNQLTVLEAIGRAGNLTDYGNRENVLILRSTKEGIQSYRINLLDKYLLNSEGYFLLPNDIVIIEPTKNKTFRLNVPVFTLFFSTTLATITTSLLLINYFKTD